MTKINNLAKLKFETYKTEDTLVITNKYSLVLPKIGFCAIHFQIGYKPKKVDLDTSKCISSIFYKFRPRGLTQIILSRFQSISIILELNLDLIFWLKSLKRTVTNNRVVWEVGILPQTWFRPMYCDVYFNICKEIIQAETVCFVILQQFRLHN